MFGHHKNRQAALSAKPMMIIRPGENLENSVANTIMNAESKTPKASRKKSLTRSSSTSRKRSASVEKIFSKNKEETPTKKIILEKKNVEIKPQQDTQKKPEVALLPRVNHSRTSSMVRNTLPHVSNATFDDLDKVKNSLKKVDSIEKEKQFPAQLYTRQKIDDIDDQQDPMVAELMDVMNIRQMQIVFDDDSD